MKVGHMPEHYYLYNSEFFVKFKALPYYIKFCQKHFETITNPEFSYYPCLNNLFSKVTLNLLTRNT